MFRVEGRSPRGDKNLFMLFWRWNKDWWANFTGVSFGISNLAPTIHVKSWAPVTDRTSIRMAEDVSQCGWELEQVSFSDWEVHDSVVLHAPPCLPLPPAPPQHKGPCLSNSLSKQNQNVLCRVVLCSLGEGILLSLSPRLFPPPAWTVVLGTFDRPGQQAWTALPLLVQKRAMQFPAQPHTKSFFSLQALEANHLSSASKPARGSWPYWMYLFRFGGGWILLFESFALKPGCLGLNPSALTYCDIKTYFIGLVCKCKLENPWKGLRTELSLSKWSILLSITISFFPDNDDEGGG